MFQLKSIKRRIPMAPPNRRNERERNRVKQVNQGFAMLRNHIPALANTKKLSKVITLRSAVDYIRTLERLLHEDQYHQTVPESQYHQPQTVPQHSPLSLDRKSFQENNNSSQSDTSTLCSVDLQMFAEQWQQDWQCR